MGRGGARDERDGSQRSCVVSRETKAPDDLIRFVVGPDDALVPDLRRKLPGRGVWASCDRAIVALAVKRKAFERSLKRPVTVPADLPDQVDALMVRDALQSLALANKAGLVSTGFAKCEALIESGRAAAAIEAADGAADGRRKIAQAMTRSGRTVPVVASFAAAELELALGRPHVIHAALAPGPAAEGFLSRWRRLVRYRAVDAGAGDAKAPSIVTQADASDTTDD